MITRHVLADVEPRDPSVMQAAEAAIADFETAIAPGIWLHLDKATLVAELRDRIHHPHHISQGGQPFCGPAAVLFELARKNPLRYIEICRNLYQLGGFYGATRFIPASEKLQKSSYGDLRMPQLDWMVLSTLREMENVLFPVEPNAPDIIRNLAGMTKSWEMRGWVKEILGFTNVDYHYAFIANDIEAINEAAQTIQQGGVAFALITAEGMLQDNPPLVPFPSHWVGVLGNITVKPDVVGLNIYTWSKTMRLEMDPVSFKRYLWATVTALP